jgi:folylpolyglutamate synthase/dihydropteroate synthase
MQAKRLFDDLHAALALPHFDTLSMGMSADLEAAVQVSHAITVHKAAVEDVFGPGKFDIAKEMGCDDVVAIDDVGEACNRALLNASADDAVLITGSLYVVGAARSHVLRVLP